MVTDQQVRRLMMLINKEKTLAIAASKAGMDAKTARKYIKLGKLPSQVKPEHTWRTRTDPFEAVWGEALGFLENNAGLEFKEIGDRQKAPMKIGRVKEMGSGKLFYRYQYQGGNIMKPRKKKQQLTFVELVESIRVTHDLFSVQAVRAVNISLTLRNWIIGFFIREYEQNGKDRAEYGTQLIERLAAHLQKGIDECYSDRYLRLCRQFYGTYPQIRKSLISKFDLIENGKTLISQLPINPTDELTCEDRTICVRLEMPPEKLLRQLSFTHFIETGNRDGACKCARNMV
ncbi:DUF1016 N-terminal domain-containing protein [Acidobacteriota bacterium]